MKIAIIGGGFIGAFIAHRLGKSYEVTLFEQGGELMNRTSPFTQGRLHSGYAYPRCATTISQSIEGYSKFISEFGEFVKSVEPSTYAVRRDGKMRFGELRKMFENSPYPLREVAAPNFLKSPENCEAFFQVEEKTILFDRLKERLGQTLQAAVALNSEVVEVNANTGSLKLRDQSEHKFDRIINATYTNPNLGLPLEAGFHFSYELEGIVCFDSTSRAGEGMSFVEGDFLSLFPNYEGRNTLRSLKNSIFARPANRIELDDVWRRRSQIAKEERVLERILEEAKEAFELPAVHNAKLWVAPNIKLKAGTVRGSPSDVRAHGRVISIFGGDFPTLYGASDNVVSLIEKVSGKSK